MQIGGSVKDYDVVVIGAGNTGMFTAASLAVSDEFTLATSETGVRKMDEHFGFIHPCCSYPTSDLKIKVNIM